ncbi:hypothetical protein GGF32_008164 [Allomyces javanicus]|nr:hypothetical protein GGF32_008164 [Allomyces javanicus]
MPLALNIQGVLNDGIVSRDFGAPFTMSSLDLHIVECPGYVTALRLYSAGPAAPNDLVAMSVTCEYAVQRADASGNAGSVWLGSVTNASVTPILVRPPASDTAIVNPPGVRSLQVAATTDRILGLGANGQHYGSLDDKNTVWQQDQDKNVKSCPLASVVMLSGDKKYARGLKLSFCLNATSSSAYSEILRATTATKIEEFGGVKARFDAHYAALVAKADKAASPVEVLETYFHGLKDLKAAQTEFHGSVKSLQPVVDGFRANPLAPASAVQPWVDALKTEVQRGSARVKYADLFGKVLNEHAVFTSSLSSSATAGAVAEDERVAASDAAYVALKDETRAEFVSHAFTAPDVDTAAFKAFLTDTLFTFPHADQRKQWDKLVKDTADFAKKLEGTTVTVSDVHQCIRGLLASDLLGESRAAALRAVEDNALVHGELASVLNIMLSRIDEWAWPTAGVKLELRRMLNGRFRVFMEEDLVTAIFLQYVGTKWSVHFYHQLHDERYSAESCLSKHEVELAKPNAAAAAERAAQLNRARRTKLEQYSMASLPESMSDQAGRAAVYSDEDKDESAGVDVAGKETASAVESKQNLLHLLTTEARYHARFHSESTPFTVVRTDFKWFGPSIVHENLLALLEVLGVPAKWRTFMHKFLAAPLILDNESSPRVRVRGIPICHALSTLFGELMLFPLDYFLTRTTKVTVVRMLDDVWMWSSNPAEMQRAWTNMLEYAALAGLALNLDKSGSAAIHARKGDAAALIAPFAPEPLPQSRVTWSSLVMHADATFRPDYENEVKVHVLEAQARLAAAPTVLAWINVYNQYARFFVRNLGAPARVWGKSGILHIQSALVQIHKDMFPETSGNVIAALAERLRRVDADVADSLLDAWVYWPLTMGGLEVHNPFVTVAAWLHAIDSEWDKDAKTLDQGDDFDELDESNRNEYKGAVGRHEKFFKGKMGEEADRLYRAGDKAAADAIMQELHSDDGIGELRSRMAPLPNLEAYVRRHHAKWAPWVRHYNQMLARIQPCRAGSTSVSLVGPLSRLAGDGPIKSNLRNMTWYWSWIVAMYGDSILNMFGTLEFMPADGVPRAMVNAVKKEKIKWSV